MVDDNVAAIIQSVQNTSLDRDAPIRGSSVFGVAPRGPLLAAWGTRQRDYDLWLAAMQDRNWGFKSAASGLGKAIASTPWRVVGESDAGDAGDASAILTQANFGAGWRDFVMGWIWNYLTHDLLGAVVEIIGPGDPLGPMWGAPTGIALLDPFHCFATGNPIWPIVYRDPVIWNRTQKAELRWLHKDRVQWTVDQPIYSRAIPGAGLCALDRAISIVDQMISTNRYVAQRVDDKPSPGFAVFSNIKPASIAAMRSNYMQKLANDDTGPLGKMVELEISDVDNPAGVQLLQFADAPKNFDYGVYTDLFMQALATALNIDVQDIWKITSSGPLGTSTQSEVLARKGAGQTPADIYAELEKLATKVLPDGFNFEFEFKDEEQDAQRAAVAAQQASTANTLVLSGVLTAEEARQYLALHDESLRLVFEDKETEIVTDRDPETAQNLDDEGAPGVPGQVDAAPAAPGAPAQTDDLPQNIEAAASLNGAQIAAALQVLDGVNTGTTAAAVAVELLIAVGIAPEIARRMVADTVTNKAPVATMKMYTVRKAWADTRGDFIDALADVFERDHTGRRGGVRLSRSIRSLLRRYADPAYHDGLETVSADRDLNTRDRMRIQAWQVAQGAFVTELIQGQQSAREPAAPDAARRKAETWADKSLRDLFNTAALTKPAAILTWVLDPAKENCISCQRLNGQTHTAKKWEASGWKPGVSKLECFGIRCGCEFKEEPTGTPESGDLSKVPAFTHKSSEIARFAAALDGAGCNHA